MSAIRVLIHDIPPLLRSAVTAILQNEEGIILLDPDSLDCEADGGSALADVVLVSASNPLIGGPGFGIPEHALPRGVVAIADDARAATTIRLSHEHWPLVDSRRDSIASAIRIAAGNGNGR